MVDNYLAINNKCSFNRFTVNSFEFYSYFCTSMPLIKINIFRCKIARALYFKLFDFNIAIVYRRMMNGSKVIENSNFFIYKIIIFSVDAADQLITYVAS